MKFHSFQRGSLELSHEVRSLLDNGMAFLEKAQKESQASPTHSIVSFWTAVEILLKVPLAHEHWSLVCSGKKIVRQNYLSGDFISVTFDETCARLSDILEKPLPKATLDAFNKIRKHRNRVVHFYHDAYTDAAKSQLLAEQADAWFALNRLMREDWKDLFEGALGSYLSSMETRLLIKNRHYANVKYDLVKNRFSELINKGLQLVPCYMCKKDAALASIVSEVGDVVVQESLCMVCGYSTERFINFKCPKCSSPQTLSAWHDAGFECEQCKHTASRYDMFDTSNNSFDEHGLNGTPGGCSDCEGYNTVCEFGDGYLCTQCLTYHETIDPCGFCGYHSTDVSEYSNTMGCSFCDGKQIDYPYIIF